MLSKICLKFGSSVGQKPLEIVPSKMVVFVGPNNSGKSLILRELMESFDKGDPPQDCKVIASVETPVISNEDAKILLDGRKDHAATQKLTPGMVKISSHHPVTGKAINSEINEKEAFNFLCNEYPEYRKHGRKYIYSHYVMSLDGKKRLEILDSRPAAGELKAPKNILGRIFADDVIRQKIRDIGFRAFGSYFVIDPTSMSEFEVRMSPRAPEDSIEEQALDVKARNFHSNALPLVFASDGMKAYLGMVSAVMCSDHRLILIDEPEAFLHPPLAKDLGRELSKITSSRGVLVFSATHSAHFLMGAIESGAEIDVVRLTYDGAYGGARLLGASDLSMMMRDPLLRSTGLLSALFHSAAVICEGDLDRAAYEELNRRLEDAGLPFCKDTIFLSAHGKDALHRMVSPLRMLGIPAIAIVDLDIIQDGLFGELLKSCGLPDGVWQAKRDVASLIAEACRRDEVKLKLVGTGGAPADVKEALKVLLAELCSWGLFLVPVGELEGWLKVLDIKAKTKRGWLYAFFEKMGKDSESSDYIRPSNGDVWNFLSAVSMWINKKDRLGIPH